MQRRDFLMSSVAATSLAGLGVGLAGAEPATREYYELRLYSRSTGPNANLIQDYWRDAAIPALNRQGSTPIGVFTEMDHPDDSPLYALIPYPSLEAFAAAPGRLRADSDYLKKADAHLNVPAKQPAFGRLESSLLLSFTGMPKLVLPANTAAGKPRIFELRTYQSPSEPAGQKKIEMFNIGEMAAMQRAGMAPVFYGEMLVGKNLPNLTYMLSAEDRTAHKQHWGAFGGDPEWKRLSGMPEYADAKLVSKIVSTYLSPTAFSQI